MFVRSPPVVPLAFVVVCGCGDSSPADPSASTTLPPPGSTDSSGEPGPSTGAGGAPTSSTGAPTSSTGGATSTPTSTTTVTGDLLTGSAPMDLGSRTDLGSRPVTCRVLDDDSHGPCLGKKTSLDLEFEVQWAWWGPGDEKHSSATPLVANLTDDDGDGDIDLCDTPDIVVVTEQEYILDPGHIHVLDGATGTLHFTIPDTVFPLVTPALGDIDGDGLVEIVAMDTYDNVVVFEHDGALKWKSKVPPNARYRSFALGDLDNDGDVEIVLRTLVLDHNGVLLFPDPDPPPKPQDTIQMDATALADLDGDGDLEIVNGRSAYHHDGSVYYYKQLITDAYPHIADFDADGLPEVLLTNTYGLSLLEHDGTTTYQHVRPDGQPSAGEWLRPGVVHDFDGDGEPEFGVSAYFQFNLWETKPSLIWSAVTKDTSSAAAPAAFDLRGDGLPELMYADEQNLFVFDGAAGEVLYTAPRSSWTNMENPVIADVDNDGSAEIVVVTAPYLPNTEQTAPTVQVIREHNEQWVQARRIWNQHTYHVTNVREDGTIPQFEHPSWKTINTFRANAQIEDGKVCIPPLQGG